MVKMAPVLAVVFALLTLSVSACSPPEPTTPPSLPPGFEEAQVPDVDLSGYVYFNAGKPARALGNVIDVPSDFDVDSLAAWVMRGGEAAGLRIDFGSAEQAVAASEAVKGRAKVWSMLQGDVLYVAYGSGEPADALKDAISSGRWASFQDRFPEAWKAMKRLPDKPPVRPVGVGFLTLDKELVDKASAAAEATRLGDLGRSLEAARIDLAAFGLYADRDVTVEWVDSIQQVKSADVRALVAARSSYPSLAVAVAFKKVVTDIGFQEVSLEAGTGYYKELDDFAVVMRNKGNVIYVAAAADRGGAESLLASALQR